VARLICKHCGRDMANAWEEDFCLKKPEKPLPFLQFVKPAALTSLGRMSAVLAEVALERTRQDTKHGINRPDDGQMMLILAEEVGEAARASQEDYQSKLREELIQVAAVAVKWVETLDWRMKRT